MRAANFYQDCKVALRWHYASLFFVFLGVQHGGAGCVDKNVVMKRRVPVLKNDCALDKAISTIFSAQAAKHR